MPATDNNAVAARLDLYADLLEISGADKYRLLAYRKAADSVRSSEDSVARLSAAQALTGLPAVGAKLAEVITAIIDTGTFPEMDQIAASVPPSLAEVMRVPGVGPKRAAQLYDKLGVTDIASLSDALHRGLVERLGGFGAKSAARIVEALEVHRALTARMPIGTALPLARSLVGEIAASDAVASAEVVGSIRRHAETVGNVDLLVVAPDAAAARASIEALARVERVLESGDTLVVLQLHDGACVHAHLTSEPAAAGARLYWTGSIEHNEALEAVAHEHGMRVDSAGLWRAGERLDVGSEEEIYRALDLAPLPPELREGARSIEIAASGVVPTIIELSDIRGDLQTHSTYTDGKDSLEHNRDMATRLGYDYIAATDHAYDLRLVGGLDIDDLERQWKEIDAINAARSPADALILKGIELNIGPDGRLDYSDDVLARFDIVLASLHSGWDEDEATITARMIRAIENPFVDIIAHPTGRVLGRRPPMRLDMDAVLRAAGRSGTIMEINSYPDRLDLSVEHIELARTYGVRFSLGTDAHAPTQMANMEYGVAHARRGGVSADELLNAQPWDVACTWLKRWRATGGGCATP